MLTSRRRLAGCSMSTNPRGVGAGQLDDAGGDPVEDGGQLQLGVEVGDDVVEPADEPDALGGLVLDGVSSSSAAR